MPAAFCDELRWPAIGGGLVSAIGFIAIAFAIGGFNVAVRRVVAVDLIAAVALVVAAILQVLV